MKKYELTKETKNFRGMTLFRIRALKSFGNVSAGDIGGWVERELNLSHSGNCWIYDNAQASYYAMVSDDVQVSGNAKVSDCARVYGQVRISDNAEVSGDTIVEDRVQVSGNAKGYGQVWIDGDMIVSGNMRIAGRGWYRVPENKKNT